jgi:hypothetical protein
MKQETGEISGGGFLVALMIPVSLGTCGVPEKLVQHLFQTFFWDAANLCVLVFSFQEKGKVSMSQIIIKWAF